MRTFCSGDTERARSHRGRSSRRICSSSGRSSPTRTGRPARRADGSSDRRRRRGISGHHRDPPPPAGTMRWTPGRHLGAGRGVDESEELQISLGVARIPRTGRGGRSCRDGDHPEPTSGQRLHRDVRAGFVMAQGQHAVGRTLDVHTASTSARHPAPPRIERESCNRSCRPVGRNIHPDPPCERIDRGIHRVPDGGPHAVSEVRVTRRASSGHQGDPGRASSLISGSVSTVAVGS